MKKTMTYQIPYFTTYTFAVMKDGTTYLNIEDYAMDGDAIVFSTPRMAPMPIPAWADRKAVVETAKDYYINNLYHTNGFVTITK